MWENDMKFIWKNFSSIMRKLASIERRLTAQWESKSKVLKEISADSE